MSINLPSGFANQVAPFNPFGRQPVGEEGVDKRETSFKAVTETEESSAARNRTDRDDRNRDQALGAKRAGTNTGLSSPDAKANPSPYSQDQTERDQREIERLAARDREVRAHELAHTSVGGAHTGAPSFTFERGPDGVAYAVSGEVSVSVTPVPGNPEATLRKAEQIQQAALAPAEPSSADRQVAAKAARMAEQARMDIRMEQLQAEKQAQAEKEEARKARQSAEREQAQKSEESRNRLAEEGRRNVNLNRKLLSLGLTGSSVSPGQLLDQTI